MDLLKSASAIVTRSFKPKSKKTRKTHSSKKSSKSSRLSRSSRTNSSYESLQGSPESKLKTVRKNIGKHFRKTGVDKKSIKMLNKKIEDLEGMKLVFTKTKKNSPKKSPQSSPVILTIKNLDTGKKEEATVIKNLDTGKYEFIGLK
jgi:hypothetical protein